MNKTLQLFGGCMVVVTLTHFLGGWGYVLYAGLFMLVFGILWESEDSKRKGTKP